MPISYKKLFYMLIDRNMKDVDLRKLSNISAPTMTKIRKNQIVQTDIIAKVCKALKVQPGDIMEYLPEEKD